MRELRNKSRKWRKERGVKKDGEEKEKHFKLQNVAFTSRSQSGNSRVGLRM